MRADTSYTIALITIVAALVCSGIDHASAVERCSPAEFLVRDDVKTGVAKNSRPVVFYLLSENNLCLLDPETGKTREKSDQNISIARSPHFDPIGEWSAFDQDSTIRITSAHGRFEYDGVTTYDASTADHPGDVRAARAAGTFENKPTWTQTSGDCGLQIRFLGPVMIVRQSPANECGGVGANFSGVYRKIGRRAPADRK